METVEAQTSGVYSDRKIKALYAPVEFTQLDSGDESIAQSLGQVAQEVNLVALYSMQAITLIMTIISAVVLSTTASWMIFAAAGFAIAFLAVATSAGFYLIALKGASEVAGQ